MCTQDLKAVVDGIEGIQISQCLGLGDFDMIRVIGRGSYAKVLLVRLKKNEQIYAMKVVKKELVHDDEVTACVVMLMRLLQFYHGVSVSLLRLTDLGKCRTFSYSLDV